MQRLSIAVTALLFSGIAAFAQQGTGQGGGMMGNDRGSGMMGQGWGWGMGGFGYGWILTIILVLLAVLAVAFMMKRK